ncbi:RNA polymerase subunit sigma-24 [Pseudomonas oryzihabitans]|nr:RNA polymerase subunit sigma-24 [Pseudomonas psychrotolerans]
MSMLDDAMLSQLLPSLRRFARSLTRHEASADDLVQSCLERALTHGNTRCPDGDVRAWLFTILYRQFVDGRRRERRYGRLLEWLGFQEVLVEPSAETIYLDQEALTNLERLNDEQRALLLLVAVEGMSYRDVSQALGIPLGTVMSRLARARAALRQIHESPLATAALRVLK